MRIEKYDVLLGTLGLLGVLVSGCVGMTSGSVSPSVEELDRYVLVLQESRGGHVTHSWRPVEEFDLSQIRFQPRAERTYGRIMLAAAHPRDCHAELDACVGNCLSQPLSEDYAHITSYGAKAAHCRKGCRQPYLDCEALQGRRPLEFSATQQAVDWLKRNRNGVLVGSIVVVAGVAFVVAFPPGALIALIPAAAFASSSVDAEPRIAAVAQ